MSDHQIPLANISLDDDVRRYAIEFEKLQKRCPGASFEEDFVVNLALVLFKVTAFTGWIPGM